MTDLESPRKNNDCYFYYYSTCAKGDNCTFRHEPSALGCETVCSFWKEGKCFNVHCNFRHMELRKNRKAIPCYWESQPGGCLKPHCPFLHQTAKPASADDSFENKTDSGTESADNTMTEKLSHVNDKSFKNTPVDSLVVNFEEESDNESAPANSPQKSRQPLKVKTLEQIRLEKIQAESAAYYSYCYPGKHQHSPLEEEEDHQPQQADSDDLRQRILERISSKKRPTSMHEAAPAKKPRQDVSSIRIKTLEEIRAERAKNDAPITEGQDVSDSRVSSTISDLPKRRKIKLQRRNLLATHPKQNVVQNVEMTSVGEKSDQDQIEKIESSTTTKTAIDEVLLLQDDDDNCNVSLKEEERLLNDDIEDFL